MEEILQRITKKVETLGQQNRYFKKEYHDLEEKINLLKQESKTLQNQLAEQQTEIDRLKKELQEQTENRQKSEAAYRQSIQAFKLQTENFLQQIDAQLPKPKKAIDSTPK